MIDKLFFYIIAFCMLFSCSNNEVDHSDRRVVSVYKNPNSLGKFELISFNELFKTPGNYNGKNIELSGVYKFAFEKSALYPDEQLASIDNSKQAVWISFHKELPLINTTIGNNLLDSYDELEKLAGKYIRVKGTLNFKSKGHESEYFAELKKIIQIEVLERK